LTKRTTERAPERSEGVSFSEGGRFGLLTTVITKEGQLWLSVVIKGGPGAIP